MKRNLQALCLSVVMALSPSRATAQTAASPASAPVSVGAPLYAPVSQAWSRAFGSLCAWLATPDGLKALEAEPSLGFLRGLRPDTSRGREAIAPLAERLSPDFQESLEGVASLEHDPRAHALAAVSRARVEALPDVEARIAAPLAAAKKGLGTAGELERLSERLGDLSFYGASVWRSRREAAFLLAERTLSRARSAADSMLSSAARDDDGIGAPAGLRPLLSPSPRYDADSWKPAYIPDSAYAGILDAAADRLSQDEAAGSPEHARNRRAQDDFVSTMKVADEKVHSHMMRVGLLSGLLAVQLGLSMDHAQQVAWGARAHDIGKRDVEVLDVINKPGKLTPKERATMERHTTRGWDLIRAREEFDDASRRTAERVALHHHEKWDGKGYPSGLKENAIPLEARIVHVADYFDALMEHRPYRAGMSVAEALGIMRSASAGFDPRVWRAFLELMAPREAASRGP